MMQGRTTLGNFIHRMLQKGMFAVLLWPAGDRNCPDFIEGNARFC